MRNKLKWFGAFLLITALLIGCSNNDDDAGNVNPPEESQDADTDQDSDTNDPSSEKNESNTNDDSVVEAPYSFIEFEVEVDMDGVNDAFEAEYEAKRTKVDASYKDKAEDIKIKDDEAMKKLEPILDGFTFDANSSEDEVLEQVLDGFFIEDYDEIEIEITFKDNSKIDFQR